MASLRQFRLLHTKHVERNANGELIEYKAGDILQSSIDLTKKFVNRFQEVIPTPLVVQSEEPEDDEDEEDDEEEDEEETPLVVESEVPERLPVKEEKVKKTKTPVKAKK